MAEQADEDRTGGRWQNKRTMTKRGDDGRTSGRKQNRGTMTEQATMIEQGEDDRAGGRRQKTLANLCIVRCHIDTAELMGFWLLTLQIMLIRKTSLYTGGVTELLRGKKQTEKRKRSVILKETTTLLYINTWGTNQILIYNGLNQSWLLAFSNKKPHMKPHITIISNKIKTHKLLKTKLILIRQYKICANFRETPSSSKEQAQTMMEMKFDLLISQNPNTKQFYHSYWKHKIKFGLLGHSIPHKNRQSDNST